MRDKACSTAKNLKHDRYQHGLASMVYKILNTISGGAIKNKCMANKELAKELHKLIIRKFKKRKVHLFFIDNIWGNDTNDMQVISKFNEGILFFFIMCYRYFQ